MLQSVSRSSQSSRSLNRIRNNKQTAALKPSQSAEMHLHQMLTSRLIRSTQAECSYKIS